MDKYVFVIIETKIYENSEILGIASNRADAKKYLLNTHPDIIYVKQFKCWVSEDDDYRYDIEKHKIIRFK